MIVTLDIDPEKVHEIATQDKVVKLLGEAAYFKMLAQIARGDA